jgi:hypothetical protein
MRLTLMASDIFTFWLSTEPVLDCFCTLRNVVASSVSPLAIRLYVCQRSSISSGSSVTWPNALALPPLNASPIDPKSFMPAGGAQVLRRRTRRDGVARQSRSYSNKFSRRDIYIYIYILRK